MPCAPAAASAPVRRSPRDRGPACATTSPASRRAASSQGWARSKHLSEELRLRFRPQQWTRAARHRAGHATHPYFPLFHAAGAHPWMAVGDLVPGAVVSSREVAARLGGPRRPRTRRRRPHTRRLTARMRKAILAGLTRKKITLTF